MDFFYKNRIQNRSFKVVVTASTDDGVSSGNQLNNNLWAVISFYKSISLKSKESPWSLKSANVFDSLESLQKNSNQKDIEAQYSGKNIDALIIPEEYIMKTDIDISLDVQENIGDEISYNMLHTKIRKMVENNFSDFLPIEKDDALWQVQQIFQEPSSPHIANSKWQIQAIVKSHLLEMHCMPVFLGGVKTVLQSSICIFTEEDIRARSGLIVKVGNKLIAVSFSYDINESGMNKNLCPRIWEIVYPEVKIGSFESCIFDRLPNNISWMYLEGNFDISDVGSIQVLKWEKIFQILGMELGTVTLNFCKKHPISMFLALVCFRLYGDPD